jgi:hypothetical protein
MRITETTVEESDESFLLIDKEDWRANKTLGQVLFLLDQEKTQGKLTSRFNEMINYLAQEKKGLKLKKEDYRGIHDAFLHKIKEFPELNTFIDVGRITQPDNL